MEGSPMTKSNSDEPYVGAKSGNRFTVNDVVRERMMALFEAIKNAEIAFRPDGTTEDSGVWINAVLSVEIKSLAASLASAATLTDYDPVHEMLRMIEIAKQELTEDTIRAFGEITKEKKTCSPQS
jgi:hypothetical protein